MKLLVLIFLVPVLGYGQVQVAGEMREIMQLAKLSATIDIDSLDRSGVYGLGVVEGLKGEIIILDGEPYVTSVVKEVWSTEHSYKIKAAMLVYEKIESWETVLEKSAIQNLQDLEEHLQKLMGEKGKSRDKPFAFIIKSNFANVEYHVIDWKKGAIHTAASHKQFAKSGKLIDSEITILGFYSSNHQGIFTHHSSKIHLHVITDNHDLVGHVDELKLRSPFSLSIAD